MVSAGLLSCEAYEPTGDPNAFLQLPFEGNLENIGGATIEGAAYDGKTSFKRGRQGKALFTKGDGSWIEYRTPQKIVVGDVVEISFSFKRSKWSNSYVAGSSAKTIAAISGKGAEKIQHVIFNISSGDEPSMYIYIEDQDGNRERLRSEPGTVSMGWHSAKLVVDKPAGTSSFFLDDRLSATADIVPAVLINGFDSVKLGTWHKKNQAYRGRIDDFVIRDMFKADYRSLRDKHSIPSSSPF